MGDKGTFGASMRLVEWRGERLPKCILGFSDGPKDLLTRFRVMSYGAAIASANLADFHNIRESRLFL